MGDLRPATFMEPWTWVGLSLLAKLPKLTENDSAAERVNPLTRLLHQRGGALSRRRSHGSPLPCRRPLQPRESCTPPTAGCRASEERWLRQKQCSWHVWPAAYRWTQA